jgi:lycopene beta-cyclase
MSTLQQQTTPTTDYDYIIAGAGCAGLSLLMRMLQAPSLQQKRILLVDKSPKNLNDRTWCFWEDEPGIFEPLVKHRWNKVDFFSNYFSATLTLSPYQYKMIEGLDLYTYCFNVIQQYVNVKVLHGNVSTIETKGDKASIVVDGNSYTAQYVFSSILQNKAFLYEPSLHSNVKGMLQHFKGWIIETAAAVFNPAVATFMDFRVSQQHGTTFMYVMPLSPNKALVEYTLFTPALLPQDAYNAALQQYISQTIGCNDYQIVHEEFGIIPMTAYRFPTHDGNIIYIGTAGGQVKASSGYAFKFIQQHSRQMVDRLTQQQHPAVLPNLSSKKFFLYDKVLLSVLLSGKINGDKIFALIFKHNSPQTVFRFLDNRSTLLEDLKIMSSVPTGIFLPAAIKELWR